jgi:MFS family permease
VPRPPLFTPLFLLASLANALLNLAAMLFVHLPGFLQQLGAGEAQIGRIMAGQSVGALLAWPLAGRAMDLRGRRVVILGGGALFIAVVGMYLTIDALDPYIYVVRVLDGAATTMWYTALFTYAADLVPAERRTEGLALFGVSGLISIGLGAQTGDVILAGATYRELFLVALVLVSLGFVLCLPLRERARANGERAQPRGVLVTAAQRDLLAVWTAAFAFFVGVVATIAFMKTFVATIGVGGVATFFGAYAAIAAGLRIGAGWLPDRLGTRRMLGLALSAYAAGFLVLSGAGTTAAVVAAGLLCGAGHGYTFPTLFSLVVERARPEERGAAAAFFTSLDWLALLVAGPIVGYAIERTGYGSTFFGLAIFIVVGLGAFYSLDRRGESG